MDLLTAISNFLKNKEKTIEVPDGLCPNCWGQQEYEGKFLVALRTEKIDLNNISAKKGWIQAYVTRHFEGIRLKETSGHLQCPACKLIHKSL